MFSFTLALPVNFTDADSQNEKYGCMEWPHVQQGKAYPPPKSSIHSNAFLATFSNGNNRYRSKPFQSVFQAWHHILEYRKLVKWKLPIQNLLFTLTRIKAFLKHWDKGHDFFHIFFDNTIAYRLDIDHTPFLENITYQVHIIILPIWKV